MGKTRIIVDCIDQRLIVANDPLLASGGQNEDEIEFNFCPLWDGFGKTAVFYRTPDEVYNVVVVDNRCTIPAEVLIEKGEVYFGVFGTKDSTTRTSEVLRYNVVQGALLSGKAPAEPTPDVYAQLMSQFGEVDQRLEGVEDALGEVDQRLEGVEGGMTPEGIGAKPAFTVLPVGEGGTNAQTATDARKNLGAASEAEVKAQAIYTVFGKIVTANTGTAEGYGSAIVYVHTNGVVRVDFAAKIETAGSVTNDFGVGIYPTQLNALNSDIPASIETIRGGVINYYSAEGNVDTTKTGYAGVAESAKNKTIWGFARVYTLEGGVGAWGDNAFSVGMRVSGTVYGKIK